MKRQKALNIVTSAAFRLSFGGGGWGGVITTCVPTATEMFKRIGIRSDMVSNIVQYRYTTVDGDTSKCSEPFILYE